MKSATLLIVALLAGAAAWLFMRGKITSPAALLSHNQTVAPAGSTSTIAQNLAAAGASGNSTATTIIAASSGLSSLFGSLDHLFAGSSDISV